MGEKLKALLKKPVFWIAIGGVALFAIIRGRMQSQAQQSPSAVPQAFTGGGGGGGTDTGFQGGTNVQDQLAQQDIANQQERLRQGAALFNFDLQQKQKMADLFSPLQQAWEKTQEALQGNQTLLAGKIASQIGATHAQCAHGDAKIDPATGQLYCRTNESGGSIFQRIGQGINNVVSGAFQGAANAAPGIVQGYLGQQIGSYGSFLKQQTGQGQTQRQPQQQAGARSDYSGMLGGQFPATPPIA